MITRRAVKERLTVTVDPGLVQAGALAVAEGRADSLSAWVNAALAERAAKEQRQKAMSDALAAYEAEFGAITVEEMAAQQRADRERAVVIRGSRRRGPGAKTHRARRAA